MQSVENIFDIIFIDCSPSLGLLPLNALACSTDILIPCCAEYLHYRGLRLLERTIEMVRDNLNENLNVYGVIVSRYERTNHNKEILEKLKEDYRVLGVVPKAVAVSDAVYGAGPIVASEPDNPAAIAYKAIADIIYQDIIKEKEREDN